LAIATYVLWGALPIYWKQLETVSSLEVLCSRIVWGFGFIFPLTMIIKDWRHIFFQEIQFILREHRTLLAIIGASILITINWFTFIYAVSHDMIMESSLGYFINPMVNVLLAIIFLKERLSKAGVAACILALLGVAVVTVEAGVVPWASLIMAFSFSFYGLIKKGVKVKPFTSLTVETLLVLPFALVYLLFFAEAPMFSHDIHIDVLLILAGVVTAVPLLLFAEATKRISYIAIGFTQYISPTVSFFIAFFLYHESLTSMKLGGFCLIWVGIIVYSLDSILALRRTGRDK
jgi:chloramphenicol-sensitive protein RarD